MRHPDEPKRFIYCAGPITGLEYAAATDWRANGLQRLLRDRGWIGLSPMRGKEKFKIEGPLPSTFDEGRAAVMRDLYDIRRSEAVLVNLVGAERVSIGTMAELGYAYALGKYIIVVIEEEDALHDHIFVNELASQVVSTLDDALSILEVL